MTDEERALRLAAVREAQSWIGTRYHDSACIKIRRGEDGTIIEPGGVDCAQIVYAVYRAIDAIPEFEIPQHSPQWMLHRSEEIYLNHALKYARPTDKPEMGDLVLYKFGRLFSHGAIIDEDGWPNIIHAHQQAGIVMRSFGDQGALAGREMRFFTLWP